MKKIIISKDLIITNEAEFSSEIELQTWKNYHEEIGTFRFENKIIPAVIDPASNQEIYPSYILPKIHDFVILDVSLEKEAETLKQIKIEAGKNAREACQKVLDYVAGANLDRELTIEQITDMQTVFSQAEAALRAGRPFLAKIYINAIDADEVLVTSEMKAACLELLAGY